MVDASVGQQSFFKMESSPTPHLLSLERSDIKLCQEEVSPSRISEDIDMQDMIPHNLTTQVTDKVPEKSKSDSNKKKKKGKVQIFYCSDFPPCNLSFTRSEHLARHIRKHTGERPFQCHCNRRFSRLDNLRQHAQSIHQNEEIPEDSLALISSRSQRQIRNEKGKVVGNRTKSNSAGSQTGPIRDHKRNSWSLSSISSVGSVYSASYVGERSLPNSHVMPVSDKMGFGRDTPGFLDSELPPIKNQPLSPIRLSISPVSDSMLASSESLSWKSSPDSPFSGHINPRPFHTPNRRLSFSLPFDNSLLSSPCKKNEPTAVTNLEGFSLPPTHTMTLPTLATSSLKQEFKETNILNEEPNRRRTWHPDLRTSLSLNTQQSNLPPLITRDLQTQPTIPQHNAPTSLNILRLPGIESFGPLYRPKTPPPHIFSYLKRDSMRISENIL